MNFFNPLNSGDLTARQKAELILEKELAQVEAERAKNEAAQVSGLKNNFKLYH